MCKGLDELTRKFRRETHAENGSGRDGQTLEFTDDRLKSLQMTDIKTDSYQKLKLADCTECFRKSRLCKCARLRNLNSPYLHGLALTIKSTHSIANRFKKNNSVEV